MMHQRALLAMVFVAMLAAPAVAAELRAFTATYDVFIDGKQQGSSQMQLIETSPGQWRHLIEAEGTAGLARLSGFAARQVSEFDLHEGRPRLQTASARSANRLSRREVHTRFDWDRRLAHWEGDLKRDRREPIALTNDAVNAALLNLLLALDSVAPPSDRILRYRLFERGRAESVDYRVGQREEIGVPAGQFHAVRVEGRRPSRQRVTTVWYAADLPPTPVRVLQVEPDKPDFELRLASISG